MRNVGKHEKYFNNFKMKSFRFEFDLKVNGSDSIRLENQNVTCAITITTSDQTTLYLLLRCVRCLDSRIILVRSVTPIQWGFEKFFRVVDF